MRRNAMTWGILLILAGILFLLQNLGILRVDVWGIIFPLILIGIGLNMLFRFFRPRSLENQQVSVPLEGASQARVRLRHAAGRLRAGPGAPVGTLLEGEFNGGVNLETRHDGDILSAGLTVPGDFGPFDWPGEGTLDWDLRLTQEIPLALDLETGAGETRLNLTDLRVSELRLRSGASSTEIDLPAQAGFTALDLSTGAASVRLHVPQGVAARIHARGGLASIQVDTNRFPQMGNVYQSPDYALAENRVEIEAETGVGSIDVR